MIGPIESVRIFTRDLDLARRFYARGLGLAERAAGPGYALFGTGGADLIVEQVDGDDDVQGLAGRVAGFSFTVDDCEAAVAALRARGVHVVSEPARQPWGGILAFVEDADHNLLTLVQHR